MQSGLIGEPLGSCEQKPEDTFRDEIARQIFGEIGTIRDGEIGLAKAEGGGTEAMGIFAPDCVCPPSHSPC